MGLPCRSRAAQAGTEPLRTLQRLAPWAVTVAIFAFLFWRYPVREVFATLAAARWGAYLALMIPYSLFYCAVDAFVLQQAVAWFLVRVSYRDILPVRATAYILSLVNTPLGQGGIAVYLHRRHRIPFWQVTGTVLFVAVVEIYQLAWWSMIGGALSRAPSTPWMAYAVLALGLAAMWLYGAWWRRRPAAPGRLRILDTIRRARPGHYLRLVLYKTPNLLAAVVVHWLGLPLFGIAVPFEVLLTFLPLVFFFAALPVAAAHLGPSQLAWTWFFGPYAPGERLLAYSLAAHFLFMVLNAGIGLLFVRRAARELA